jgi:hypothetical protein
MQPSLLDLLRAGGGPSSLTFHIFLLIHSRRTFLRVQFTYPSHERPARRRCESSACLLARLRGCACWTRSATRCQRRLPNTASTSKAGPASASCPACCRRLCSTVPSSRRAWQAARSTQSATGATPCMSTSSSSSPRVRCRQAHRPQTRARAPRSLRAATAPPASTQTSTAFTSARWPPTRTTRTTTRTTITTTTRVRSLRHPPRSFLPDRQVVGRAPAASTRAVVHRPRPTWAPLPQRNTTSHPSLAASAPQHAAATLRLAPAACHPERAHAAA